MENDFELIYSLPRQRMYGFMHFFCTFATITMTVFIIIHLHREMLDMESYLPKINQDIPIWVLYSVAVTIGGMFGAVLILCSWMPIRVYYAPIRRLYALFYHPIIGVFRHRKILFHNEQFRIIPQKLDTIDSPQRSIKITINTGKGIMSKKSFYLIEGLFRSKADIQQFRINAHGSGDNSQLSKNETTSQRTERNSKETNRTEEEQKDTEIWETVLERKDQPAPLPHRKKTIFR